MQTLEAKPDTVRFQYNICSGYYQESAPRSSSAIQTSDSTNGYHSSLGLRVLEAGTVYLIMNIYVGNAFELAMERTAKGYQLFPRCVTSQYERPLATIEDSNGTTTRGGSLQLES